MRFVLRSLRYYRLYLQTLWSYMWPDLPLLSSFKNGMLLVTWPVRSLRLRWEAWLLLRQLDLHSQVSSELLQLLQVSQLPEDQSELERTPEAVAVSGIRVGTRFGVTPSSSVERTPQPSSLLPGPPGQT